MSTIQILSEHLANQIAAGEVVERPASVVKECIENSIDAAARHIAIQVEGDGTRLIRVIDDGYGMDEDDVLLCLERHATSKLSDSDIGTNQLSSIVTLGFRGEAIPSVASVSRFAITSRPENATLGTRVDVKYGRVLKVHETGCSRGTVMEVRDLFGNVPARKKFLKTKRTELGHIEDVVKSYCLAFPHVGVTFQVDERVVFDLPAETDTLEKRVRWFLNSKKTEPLLKIDSADFHDDDPQAGRPSVQSLSGYLLPPDESYGPTAKLKLFVNNRVVRDRMIVHAIHEGLAGFLMKGRGAAGVLFVTINPALVDVNVHPTKQEIRFHASNQIHSYISSVIRQAILSYQDDMKFSLFGAPAEHQTSITIPQGKQSTDTKRQDTIFSGYERSDSVTAEPQGNYRVHDGAGSRPGRNVPVENDFLAEELSSQISVTPLPDTDEEKKVHIDQLHPIGQFMDLYILCETTENEGKLLVVIDQHAVHERLVFETLKKQFADQQVASQKLLFPKLIDFSPEQIQTITRHSDEIDRLGIELEEFGEQSYVVKSVPAILAHLSPEELLGAIIEEFQEGLTTETSRRATASSKIDDVLSSMACKSAVKAGRPLKMQEIQDLLQQMRDADVFSHCPHGRPVFKIFTNNDIRRWFHRT